MLLGKKQFLSLIAMGCGLWAGQINGDTPLHFRNDTGKDVYIKFTAPPMEERGIDKQVVKARDSLTVVFIGTVNYRNRPEFSYAYAIPGQIPPRVKTTNYPELMKLLSNRKYAKEANEVVFAESADDYAPNAYAAKREAKPAPAAPQAPMPSLSAGDQKKVVETTTESQVSRTAGAGSNVPATAGGTTGRSASPQRTAGSTQSTCH